MVRETWGEMRNGETVRYAWTESGEMKEMQGQALTEIGRYEEIEKGRDIWRDIYGQTERGRQGDKETGPENKMDAERYIERY